jgi:translation initiation factor 2 subunit 2
MTDMTDADIELMFNKKKKKDKCKEKEIKPELEDSGEFEYDALLSRLYKLLKTNNPDLTDKVKRKLPPPEVICVSTRTVWTNFKTIYTEINRDVNHIKLFFLTELGTTGSIDGSDRLVLKGIYPQNTIEKLLRRYIVEYVTCHMCKSMTTVTVKDAITRISFMVCNSCGSQRSVTAIKAGFHATERGERKKGRE